MNIKRQINNKRLYIKINVENPQKKESCKNTDKKLCVFYSHAPYFQKQMQSILTLTSVATTYTIFKLLKENYTP